MTIYTLKHTLYDRIKILEGALDQCDRACYPTLDTYRGMDELVRKLVNVHASLEGRLEEARVIFRLVDQVAQDQATCVLDLEIEPKDMAAWDNQQRGDWSHSTFGGRDFTETEPGIDRYDPSRC